jgi:hypothetical protein
MWHSSLGHGSFVGWRVRVGRKRPCASKVPDEWSHRGVKPLDKTRLIDRLTFCLCVRAVNALGTLGCVPIGMRRGLTRLEIAILEPVANRFGMAGGCTSATL